jgi:hypothetical protein
MLSLFNSAAIRWIVSALSRRFLSRYNQPYEFDDKAISGLFAEIETAEQNFYRVDSDLETDP